MLFCRKKFSPALKTEFSGLHLETPLGVRVQGDSPSLARKMQRSRPGFMTLFPPKEGILGWIESLHALHLDTVLAMNLRHDIARSFSLVYDFPDLIIIEPEAVPSTPEVPEITDLLDELLSLRLCYERYTPVFLRIPNGLGPDEVAPLLGYCQLAGVDGVLVSGPAKARFAREHTQGRLPVIATADNYEEALSLALDGFPVETTLSPFARVKILKSLEKQKQ